MDVEIVNRDRWQIELERLPVVSIVDREVDAGLRPGKQQAFATERT